MTAREPRFRTIVGTGAIGAGLVFRLEGDHDLGRNESRRAVLLDRRDYFKLHIILHYTASLLREAGYPTRVLPIGWVGEDDTGRRLLEEMRRAGMDPRFVDSRRDAPTDFGVCFTYPDGAGGNITPTNGASGRVDRETVRRAEPLIAEAGPGCLVLAAPEVDLETRGALLALGKAHGAFTAASYVSGELIRDEVIRGLEIVDLLALNIDEAAAVAGVAATEPAERIVSACVKRLGRVNPAMMVSITDGANGAHAWKDGRGEYLPALPVRVAGTAGAGDAYFSGLIIGLTAGLEFLGARGSCVRLARLLAAISVTSPDTINFEVGLPALRVLAERNGETMPL